MMAASTWFNPILGFHPSSSSRSRRSATNLSSFNIPASSSISRSSYAAKSIARKTLHTTFASNSDPQAKETGNSSSNETERTPQGPPFLTIVAGALVFLLVCWAVGSLVIWIIGPIVNLFASK